MSKFGPWATAHWDSECDWCGDYIPEGEQLRANGEGGWICEICGREDEDGS